MARQTRVIFGDTTALRFENPHLKARKEARSTFAYLPGGANVPAFKLRQLGGSPILEWPAVLPDIDPRGHPSVRNGYQPWKNAKASRVGLPGYIFSRKGGGKVPHHSDLEKRVIVALEFCPYVVEIRVQYPEWDEERLARIVNRGGRVSRTEVMTLDIMATLKIPGCSEPIYHAISVKPEALLDRPGNQRRHSKERHTVYCWDATHEVMTDQTISYEEHGNNLQLLAYMQDVEKIEELAAPAEAFALVLRRTRIRGSLDRVIKLVAHRFGWDLHTGYRMFAVAHFLGHLVWNHDHRLALDRPMMLRNRLL